MASIRFGIFGYAIIFMIAYSLQDAEKMTVRAGEKFVEKIVMSQQEKNALNSVHSRTEVIVNSKTTGGRKMMNEETLNGEEEMVSKKALSSSNANPRNGDLEKAKKSKKMDYHYHDGHDQNQDLEVRMKSTFMAMNADYHVPRSHPPRNN